ncbi:cobalamin B12-binding domain-containing protein [Streptomyces sp. NBC_00334]|uniref:cobalamin B12-binding domain-containing protein n=1 Tax=Streptomyces sp. NBC_00334 TaxID=2975713 RepID=UPI002E2DF914|nr:cobalamin B12-binding domain-containing protein [Streptomyces sp. NBC_00334]
MPAATSTPHRVVVAEPGLDRHDRGAEVIARALRDAGIEVVSTGLHQTPRQIVDTALQEDADGIGPPVLSGADTALQEDADGIGPPVLSGAHMTLFAEDLHLLREQDATDITVFGGGIIPDAGIPPLLGLGVAAPFTPGTTTRQVTDRVHANVARGAC